MVTRTSTQQSKDSQTQMEDGGEPSRITMSSSDKVFIYNLSYTFAHVKNHCSSEPLLLTVLFLVGIGVKKKNVQRILFSRDLEGSFLKLVEGLFMTIIGRHIGRLE